jgi:hypothetical protein
MRTHAGPLHALAADECAWRFHLEDVDMYCNEQPIPGGLLCSDHDAADRLYLSARPGVARWPRGVDLPAPWYGCDPPSLECDLCGGLVGALWPLLHYPSDPDFAPADGDWFVCLRCALAVRP